MRAVSHLSFFPHIYAPFQESTSPAHIWWCPTGSFAFLPLHAAGVYDINGKELKCTSNYMISSYTPTLDVLLAPLPSTTNEFKMLTVIQPEIPAKPYLALPFTYKELENIEQKVPKLYLTKLGTVEEPTSIDKVLSHLSTASIVHFACHGVQNLKSPLDSALILSDGDLKMSKIMELSMPSASLAFLSACQTAIGNEEVPDEAIHIAGSMLFAGFRGVVGTMW
jgi:CHAT domain-containing protein